MKYIHYCWFGGKPLSKLTKKCIKSWQKYLPDYEIKEWSEKNVNLDACPFIKEAYENKKWAFVADYTRTKALYEYGGIYFDTDMLLTNNIDFLLKHETFLGVEDSGMVNAAVWGASKPHTKFAKKMLDFYESQDHFEVCDMYSYSIPRIMTKMLEKCNFKYNCDAIQKLDNGSIYIYPREYFYPLSYDYQNNTFTSNTCMIHYFDATWIPKWEQRENKLIRRFGKKWGQFIIDTKHRIKRVIKKIIKLLIYPLILYYRYRKKINKNYLKMIDNTVISLQKFSNDYVVFHNPEWFGVTSATIELFDNRVACGELHRKKDIKRIANVIKKNNINQVIFSAMCIGWINLAECIKHENNSVKIKVFWHGNHSQVSEPYGWQRNLEIIEAHKAKIIDVFATCKESLINFYKKEGYTTAFITNKVDISDNVRKQLNNKNQDYDDAKVRVGLYAAKSDDWRKNMFAQIAAVSLIDNAVLDIVPLNPYALKFAKTLGLEVTGIKGSLPREDLLVRMSHNDINLYVTLSECSPMLPLESFEVEVPCITGNNHHYFKNTELEDYLVVSNEADPVAIKEKMIKTLNNKDKVKKLFENWSNDNKKKSKEDVANFLKM